MFERDKEETPVIFRKYPNKYEAIDEARQLAATSSRTGDWVNDFETELEILGYVIRPKPVGAELFRQSRALNAA